MKKFNLYLSSIFKGLHSSSISSQLADAFLYALKFVFAGQATIFIALGIKRLLGYEISESLGKTTGIGIGILFLLILWRTHVFIRNRTYSKKFKPVLFSPSKAWLHFTIGFMLMISPSIIFILLFVRDNN